MTSRRTTSEPFLRAIALRPDRISDPQAYPFTIPAVASLGRLELHPRVTFFIGDNGSGKSTIMEAIAVAAGFNAEGGSKHFQFATRSSESELHRCLRLERGARRPRTGFFFRAEAFFNVATHIEQLDEEPFGGRRVIDSYGGTSLHEQSHGESFTALIKHRFFPEGLYILDEPEAALSTMRQLALVRTVHELSNQGAQFIIATHSPIVLAYPEAKIYELTREGIAATTYEKTEPYTLTRDFLNNRERFLRSLLSEDAKES
jgi:predicted ATPase